MKPKDRYRKFGPELFYTDESGKMADADLHSEMLDISPEAEARVLSGTVDLAREIGISEKSIEALFVERVGHATGGAVKMTKGAARYRVGTNAEHCGICTMFREPNSCTAVSGKIRWMDTCKIFEKRK